MTDDPVRTYLDARKALEQASSRAERVVNVITNAGDMLKNWHDVRITGISFPMSVGHEHSINADQWPTVQQLAEVLVAWHDANHAVENAWANIPMPDKKGLVSPAK